MAYDEGHLTLLRDDLVDEPGIVEKKMFGGICFMLNGNMLCGVHKGGGMFRVGKDLEAEALAIEGASEGQVQRVGLCAPSKRSGNTAAHLPQLMQRPALTPDLYHPYCYQQHQVMSVRQQFDAEH